MRPEDASPGRRAWARLRRNRAAMAGAWTLVGIFVLCFVVPAALGLDAQTTDPARHLEPPGSGAWLGRDSLGRDYLARVFIGGQTSLLVGLAATLASVTIGVFYGMVAGYYGGRVDEAMMRLVDFLYLVVRWASHRTNGGGTAAGVVVVVAAGVCGGG